MVLCIIVRRSGSYVVTALRGTRVVLYFRNDNQILLIRKDSSGWFSLSVVPISYVVGVGCSSLLFTMI